MPTPLLSIITSTLNAENALPYTIASLAGQRGASFEWIVQDGASTDGTIALLTRHAGLIALWASEPDGGIYDAWNKVCGRARGEWLLFLGAGDEFISTDTLASFSAQLVGAHPAHDLVYGKLRHISEHGRRDLDDVGAPWSEMQGRWELGRPALPPHQVTFHHRSLFAQTRAGEPPFDPRFRIAGDSHFMLRRGLARPPLFIPQPLVRTPMGGLSMRLRSAAPMAREIALINRELGLRPPLGHRVAEWLLVWAKLAVACLPPALGYRIADLYRRLTGHPPRWSVR
jgi:glycosyltransferase involved in cell wall biosynthesis